MNPLKIKGRYFRDRIKKKLSSYNIENETNFQTQMKNKQDKQMIQDMWENYLNFTRLEF